MSAERSARWTWVSSVHWRSGNRGCQSHRCVHNKQNWAEYISLCMTDMHVTGDKVCLPSLTKCYQKKWTEHLEQRCLVCELIGPWNVSSREWWKLNLTEKSHQFITSDRASTIVNIGMKSAAWCLYVQLWVTIEPVSQATWVQRDRTR